MSPRYAISGSGGSAPAGRWPERPGPDFSTRRKKSRRRALLPALPRSCRSGRSMASLPPMPRSGARPDMTFDFKGRRVVITGGSRGIGRSIALEFAKAGADVSICARGEKGLAAAKKEIESHGHRCHAGRCDLADGDAIARYIA